MPRSRPLPELFLRGTGTEVSKDLKVTWRTLGRTGVQGRQPGWGSLVPTLTSAASLLRPCLGRNPAEPAWEACPSEERALSLLGQEGIGVWGAC